MNNVLTITDDMPIYMDPTVYYNAQASRSSFALIDTLLYNPVYNTGTLLNAYIPRMVNRPATAQDCNGEVDFERVSMVADVELEYAINGGGFSPLIGDNLTGLCAFDTIEVIGFSPTVLVGDTLVELLYLLRSEDSLQYPGLFDLSEVDMVLNGPLGTYTNCNNHLEFLPAAGVPWSSGLSKQGVMFDNYGKYMYADMSDLDFNKYAGLCQGKYYIRSIDGEIDPVTYSSEVISGFSFTILDENNVLHDFNYDFDLNTSYPDTNTCEGTHTVVSTGPQVNAATFLYAYTNTGSTYSSSTVGNQMMYSEIDFNDLCPGVYRIDMSDRRSKIYIATDSLQKIYANYDEIVHGDNWSSGTYDTYYSVPIIDTIIHYYEECVNDYSQPFNSIVDNIDNLQTPTLGNANVFSVFEEYSASFDLVQNGTPIYLPQREVVTPYSTTHYVIAELYCDDFNKAASSTIKRRRIIVAPDGTISDIYDPFSDVSEKFMEDFKLFPNPTLEELTVNYDGTVDVINVYSLSGQLMKSQRPSGSQMEHRVDVSVLEQGTYVLELVNNSNMISRKMFVKM